MKILARLYKELGSSATCHPFMNAFIVAACLVTFILKGGWVFAFLGFALGENAMQFFNKMGEWKE